MLSVSLDCHFLIVPSIFSNDYFIQMQNIKISHKYLWQVHPDICTCITKSIKEKLGQPSHKPDVRPGSPDGLTFDFPDNTTNM